MTCTPTLPLDDRSMWRRLLARAHPDTGGTHELFIWAVALRDMVCDFSLRAGAIAEADDYPSRRREDSTPSAGERVPFDEDAFLEVLTDRVIAMAEAVAEPYGYLLRQLADCCPAEDGPLHYQQRRGASYKTLAAIGHTVGMSKAERVQWYRIAETIPLSQRHAGHIGTGSPKAPRFGPDKPRNRPRPPYLDVDAKAPLEKHLRQAGGKEFR